MSPLPRLALLLALGALGCRATSPTAYTPPSEERRDTARAEALTREAADLITSDPARAEALLRNALAADIFHGPAHNNLGVVFLERGELYEAAHEFEWARKLMPGKADPRMNLALTLETAGRVEEALREYATAHEVDPDHLPTRRCVEKRGEHLQNPQQDVHRLPPGWRD